MARITTENSDMVRIYPVDPLYDKEGHETGRYSLRIEFDAFMKVNRRKTRHEIHKKASEMLEVVFRKQKDIDEVEIVAVIPQRNSNDPAIGIVIKMKMKRTKAEKVNWKKFKPNNLPRILETYWIHPSLLSE
ncbi:hypothetical protein [[Eubacterium] cellulosolvens]